MDIAADVHHAATFFAAVYYTHTHHTHTVCVCVSVCVYVGMHMYVYVMYVCMYMYIYAHTHTHTHTHTLVSMHVLNVLAYKHVKYYVHLFLDMVSWQSKDATTR